jgi:hypothetical protein
MKRALIGLSLVALAALTPLVAVGPAYAFDPQPEPPKGHSKAVPNPNWLLPAR